jgi:sugar phosphate permease
VIARRIDPAREHILRQDPARMRLRDAVLYVLRIRTNRWLIAASAIGYFFFAGLRTFGVVFVRGQFGLDQASAAIMLFLAGLGSLAGVLIAGRIADRLIARGMIGGRVVVGAIAYLVAFVVLMPALLLSSVATVLPFLIVAGAALAAPNPPLDAARLDIVPARLWGRAEGVRTLLRQAAQAGAPLLFGAIADALGGRGGTLGSRSTISPASAHALKYTFLIMLVPLAINGIALLLARRSYPTDVATAVASERQVASER